jgi:signal transduction histidine kinase/DNA-binding response OmpR family regulator/ligand-binding sensor domain-containing protein
MKFAVFIGLLWWSVLVQAQSYQWKVRHLSMEDGLPNNFVGGTLQDQEGFMWMATNYGFCRFDGLQFQYHHQHTDNQLSGASYNRIRSIYQDKTGKIWLSYLTRNAFQSDEVRLIEIHDPVSGTTLSFDAFFKNKAPFAMRDIAVVAGYTSAALWIATVKGVLYRYDGDFHKIGTLPATSFYLPSFFYKNMIAGDKVFWNIDAANKRLYEMTTDGKLRTYPLNGKFEQGWVDQDGTLWMAPLDRWEIWSKKPGQPFQILPLGLNPALLKDGRPVSIIRDHAKRLWHICGGQIVVFDHRGRLLLSASKDQPFRAAQIHGAMLDRQGQVWLHTNNGVFVVSIYQSPFQNYLTGSIQDIRGIIAETPNHIYVNRLALFEIKDTAPPRSLTPSVYGLGNLKIGAHIWLGSYTPAVFQYDLHRGTLKKLPIDTSQTTPLAYAATLYQSKKTGRIWLGGYRFLGYLNAAHNQVEIYRQYNRFTQLQKGFVQFFYENTAGIWLCTEHGLYLLDEQKGIMAYYGDVFPFKDLLHLHEDKNGIFWIATRGGGLLRWDRTRNRVQQFRQQDGLSNDVLYAVYEDAYGYLWLPSNYGLMRFNKTTHETTTYLPKDGIPNQEFNYTSHTQAPDGRLFFGNLGGVTAFYPKDFIKNTVTNTPLRITAYEKSDNNGMVKDHTRQLLSTQQIVLHPGERSFTLKVALLEYMNTQNNRYAYRIEGLSRDWTYLSDQVLHIGGIPYGEYTLHIRAKTHNGTWSTSELHLPIRVQKPFYLQTGVIALAVITGILLLVFFRYRHIYRLKQANLNLEKEVARRTATIKQQAQELQALDKQKSRFFLNIAHDLRTPLTLITTPLNLLLEHPLSAEKQRYYLQSIQKSTRQLLGLVESVGDLFQLDARQLKLQEKPLDFFRVVQGIFAMYESHAQLHRVEYTLDYQPDRKLHLLLDQPKFEKIVHNLIANAFKFTTTGGKIGIQITEQPDTLTLHVTDTGTGIHPEDLPRIFDRYFQSQQANAPLQGGSGIGLAIVQEYAQLMQGKVEVTSHPGKGSTFTFQFPKKSVSLLPTSLPDTALLPTASSPLPPPTALNGKQTVLVVEDNVAMQVLLCDILQAHYRCLRAENGVAALEILQQQPVDCCITDLMMPQMDGFELVDALKKNSRWQSVPVIVLTARANETDKLQALRMGIDDYLYKPFSPAELLTRVQNLLNYYENRRTQRRLDHLVQEHLESADHVWLQQVEQCALRLLGSHPGFTLFDLAAGVSLSERHLRRRIQEVTGMAANEYLREIRLQKARQLLEHRAKNTIAEVSYAIGFSSAGYFTKVFTERFGKKPADY